MVLPRSRGYSSIFRSQPCRTARLRAAGQTWRQIGRRFYASGHHAGGKKASSDLPWLIGSVAVTVPSATWLWQQGPKKSDHGDHHGHGEHKDHEDHEEHDENEKEEADDQPEDKEESKPEGTEKPNQEGDDEGGEDQGDDEKPNPDEDKRPIGEKIRNEPPNEITSTDNKWTSGDAGLKEGPDDSIHKKSHVLKTVDPDADEGKKPGPSQDVDKNHEGEQKGTRVTEGDKNRKAEDPRSNSMNPYFADERKSKKAEGVAETGKLTGTVDAGRKLR